MSSKQTRRKFLKGLGAASTGLASQLGKNGGSQNDSSTENYEGEFRDIANSYLFNNVKAAYLDGGPIGPETEPETIDQERAEVIYDKIGDRLATDDHLLYPLVEDSKGLEKILDAAGYLSDLDSSPTVEEDDKVKLSYLKPFEGIFSIFDNSTELDDVINYDKVERKFDEMRTSIAKDINKGFEHLDQYREQDGYDISDREFMDVFTTTMDSDVDIQEMFEEDNLETTFEAYHIGKAYQEAIGENEIKQVELEDSNIVDAQSMIESVYEDEINETETEWLFNQVTSKQKDTGQIDYEGQGSQIYNSLDTLEAIIDDDWSDDNIENEAAIKLGFNPLESQPLFANDEVAEDEDFDIYVDEGIVNVEIPSFKDDEDGRDIITNQFTLETWNQYREGEEESYAIGGGPEGHNDSIYERLTNEFLDGSNELRDLDNFIPELPRWKGGKVNGNLNLEQRSLIEANRFALKYMNEENLGIMEDKMFSQVFGDNGKIDTRTKAKRLGNIAGLNSFTDIYIENGEKDTAFDLYEEISERDPNLYREINWISDRVNETNSPLTDSDGDILNAEDSIDRADNKTRDTSDDPSPSPSSDGGGDSSDDEPQKGGAGGGQQGGDEYR